MKQNPTRQTLISKVADQTDEAAWEEFVSYYQDYLEKVLYKTGLNEEEVKDFSQMTFVRVWEKIPEFTYNPKRGRFRSWFTQIALNYISNHRRLKSTSSSHIDIDSEVIHDSSSEMMEQMEQEWQVFIAEKAWEKISSKLSDVMKQAFELHLEGFTSAEIGQELNIAESTARVYKKRISFKLKYEIERLEQELS